MDSQVDEEDEEAGEEIAEIEKWSDYVEKYCSLSSEISEEIKESLLKKPVFLTRNAHHLKQRYESTKSTSTTNDETKKTEINGKSLTPIKEECEGTEKKANELMTSDESVYQFMYGSYKPKFGLNSSSMMYRRNALRNAKRVNLFVF